MDADRLRFQLLKVLANNPQNSYTLSSLAVMLSRGLERWGLTITHIRIGII
jgi:hypothetical protein